MNIPVYMRMLLLATLLPIVGTTFAGCARAPAEASQAKSDKPRDTEPQVDQTDLDVLVSGNTEFALQLYQALREEDKNLFYSPHSISIALAMTYAGARGQTEAEMAETLHFRLPQDRLHSAFNALDLELARRAEPVSTPDGDLDGFRLNIANSLWGQRDHTFLPEFLDLLSENYDAGMRLVDFATATEEARLAINQWVSDKTEGLIKDLIPQGILDAMTRLVLVNAIYFKAAWMYPFEESLTADGDFKLIDGSSVTVPMMSQVGSFRYVDGDGYQAVELPYIGQKVAMDIILADEGQFSGFEEALEAAFLQSILAGLEWREVAVSMPKFEYESEFSLSRTLIEMGMPTAFSGGADLSGMDGTQELFIKEVLHKAFVAVDEEGTEAAAATAVVVAEKGMAEPPVAFSVDRPFLFLIRDLETGAILFLGRVLNPAALG